jgi:predicted Rossmann-fold nucleotide-binding protein
LLTFNNSGADSSKSTKFQREETIEISSMSIKETLIEYTDKLMALPGVVGTAQGLCQETPCIKVYVTKKTPQLEKQIHSILEEYPYQIQETGKIRPRSY